MTLWVVEYRSPEKKRWGKWLWVADESMIYRSREYAEAVAQDYRDEFGGRGFEYRVVGYRRVK